MTRTEEGNGVSLSGCSSAQSFLIFVKREKQWKLGEARCNAMRYASPLSRRTVDTSRASRTCASMERSNRLADLLARSNCFRQKRVPMYRYVHATHRGRVFQHIIKRRCITNKCNNPCTLAGFLTHSRGALRE